MAAFYRKFLRLLLATSDSAALEQARRWDEAQFDVRPYLISRFCNFRYSVGSAP